MAPATEIALLPLKTGDNPADANSKAGSVWQDCMSTVLDQDGAQRAYWGREVENPSTIRLFIDWESKAHHEKFMATETYGPFVEKLMTIMDGAPTLYHATFDPHPASAALSDTNAPATEIITAYFPASLSNESRVQFEKDVKSLVAVIEEHAEGYKGSAGGWVMEEIPLPKSPEEMGKVYVAVIGWESVEAHMAFRKTDHFKGCVHYLTENKHMVDRQVVHAHLVETQPGFGHGEKGGALNAQEEVLNPQAGGKASVKTRADGTTTKNSG